MATPTIQDLGNNEIVPDESQLEIRWDLNT